MKWLLLKLITLYQKLFSPDHSFWAKKIYPHGYCRFKPTCSEYGHESIKRFGIIKGSWIAIKRVFRCNPWNEGGYDPVPEKHKKRDNKDHKKLVNK